MAIEYREWREGDDLALLEIWGDPETHQAGQFRGALAVSSSGAHGEPWRRCIVAEDVVDGIGIPVAAGVVYEASLHPERLWAYIEVARDHRRAGIGATLLTMLRREAEESPSGVSRLRAKVQPGTAGAAFAETFGLKPIQRSRLVVVDAAALRLPAFPSSGDAGGRPANGEDAGSDIVMDLATGSVELSDVVGRYYSSIHGWDSPGTLGVGQVQKLFLDELTGAHGAIVLRARPESAFGSSVAPAKKGRIRAFAVSYADAIQPGEGAGSQEPTDVFIGHEPDLEQDDAAEAVRDLLSLVAYQHPVMVELDDSMAALRAAVEPLLAGGKARLAAPETLIVSD
ncbi:GNAT family N-acetyltransferase [Pseudarthrobacter sp. J75]|uniref:GNAT family N-acetyltransferase n=1 Tax=unclassified Pseudarthrobacter TaxID=2647000 RepID=UPI002E80AB4B|nr:MULTISPECIES: GNAT family N-acetyltransferase [unclassified Pseudarthrobacter]MEE2521747.1 GNAT family N-acetyltransferase [Pseudarthrobacter sp. J47]MEE2527824.1 GNAT family N-acetyltransferase [Pseudarthrobacter sp. J75]MEE2569392.1 GNAT family N-acetyltransferase [Pseudarthrobacter sp. J64]